MKAKLIGIALIAVTATAVTFYPNLKSSATVQTQTVEDQTQKIEVVFVLDTTSSMTDLIETAKEQSWSIATTMAQAEQAPDIRLGLVAFRDRSEEYVTQVVDLSSDLDSMYATLMQFAAAGGGDGPESVNQALNDAIHQISWSQDPSSYQVVFLVGDAPPHMDYQGEMQYPQILEAATERGIVVNTIQCGDVQQTVGHWTQIASLGNGRYMKVSQAGDAFAVATPYDEEIAELSAQLDQTRLFYGDEEEVAAMDRKIEATDSLHALASVAARARRAVFNATAAGAANLFGEKDLVDDIASGEVALEDLPEAEMPAALRGLDRDAQEARVAGLAGRRNELQRQIEQLTDARSDYVDEVVGETEDIGSSLDLQIYEAVREQAAPKGLTYESGPEF